MAIRSQFQTAVDCPRKRNAAAGMTSAISKPRSRSASAITPLAGNLMVMAMGLVEISFNQGFTAAAFSAWLRI